LGITTAKLKLKDVDENLSKTVEHVF